MNRLIVGLGNPGVRYEMTRHNIGWLALDQLHFYEDLRWREKFKGLFATRGNTCFLKPLVYMNLSGESVSLLTDFFKIEVEDILVVYDEIDLPFGTLIFKRGGGTAGHNGLKSLVAKLGDNKFNRLRLGIGRPLHGSVSDYVLQGFSANEETLLPKFLLQAAKAIETYLEKGFQQAAAEHSKKSVL